MQLSNIITRPVSVEKREDGQDVIAGYASVFYSPQDAGTEFELSPKLRERILPGAFSRALAERQDVRALFNHDSASVLGRVGAGTLRLTVDHIGLRYEIDAPDTQLGRDLVTSIRRGDIAGSSFAFVSKRHSYLRGGEYDIRMIEDVDLFDVGPVTYPAYSSTTADIRARTVRESLEDYYRWTMDERAKMIDVRMQVLRLDEHHVFDRMD